MAQRLTTYEHAGLRFDVRDEGALDGPVVVALHGFPQTSRSWHAVTPHLTAAGLRVLAPDQRGYSPGARPAGVAAYALEHLVGDVLALADAAGARRFHVLGHDWGGGVGWGLAAWHPDRVRSLTVASTPHPRALVAAMPHGQARRSWYMAAFQVPRLPELLLARPRVLHRLLAAMDTPDEASVAALLTDHDAARATLGWYRAAARSVLGRGSEAPGRVAVPTTYVWSDRDPALGRWAAERTADWLDGDYRFVVLEGVSHWIPEERPADLARLALERISQAGEEIS